MKKETILNFFKEFISYVIILLIILLIADKKEWTTTSVLDNLIGLSIGWLLWKLIITFMIRKKKMK